MSIYRSTQTHKHDKQLKAGFSLIEIIVAVTIVGLMLGLGFGAFKWVQNARISKARTQLTQLRNNIIAYEAQSGQYPERLENLVTKPANARNWMQLSDEADLMDPWNHEYQYKRNAKGAKPPYDLYSYGASGEAAPENEYIRIEEPVTRETAGA